jgi:hypothetical protein
MVRNSQKAPPISGSRRLWRDLLNKPDDAAAQFWVPDTHERLHQRQAIRRGEEICHVGGRGSISRPLGRLPHTRRGGRALEEERDRHLQDLGNVLQSAGADAVGPLFVFLDLLECQPEGVREIGLAHIEHEPPHAHPAADMPVSGIDSAPWHSCSQWLQRFSVGPVWRNAMRPKVNVARLGSSHEWVSGEHPPFVVRVAGQDRRLDQPRRLSNPIPQALG